jgi:hypothetical protein
VLSKQAFVVNFVDALAQGRYLNDFLAAAFGKINRTSFWAGQKL